jgi:hypothetical protein
MKAHYLIGALATLLTVDAFAQSYRQCTYHRDRWGNSYQRCRVVHHRPSNPTNDAVVIGAIAGGTAGYLASTCAPEIVEGNLSATERALVEIANTEAFEQAEKFQDIVDQIITTHDAKEKMGLYLTLVDVNDATEIAHFIGARENELSNYTQALEARADLSSEQAQLVVEKMITTLKGGLR